MQYSAAVITADEAQHLSQNETQSKKLQKQSAAIISSPPSPRIDEIVFPRPVINVGNFVLVRMASVKARGDQVHFVGVVIEIQIPDYAIKCMRRHGLAGLKFKFPVNDDVAYYSQHDIVVVLDLPKVVRGVYQFSDDLTSFNLR